MANVTWLVVGIALLLIAIGLAIWAGFIYRQAQIDARNRAGQIFIPMMFYILIGIALLLFIGAIVAMVYAFYYPTVAVATATVIPMSGEIIEPINPYMNPIM